MEVGVEQKELLKTKVRSAANRGGGGGEVLLGHRKGVGGSGAAVQTTRIKGKDLHTVPGSEGTGDYQDHYGEPN